MTDENNSAMPEEPIDAEVGSEAAPEVAAEAAVEAAPAFEAPAAPEAPAVAAPPAAAADGPMSAAPQPVAPPPPAPAEPAVAPPAAPAYAPPVPPAPPAPPAAPAGYAPPTAPGYAPPTAPQAPPMGEKQKIVAGILAILLGSLGIHKFYLGYNKEGIILLAVTVVGSVVAIGPAIASIIGIIEGVMYLTKTDEEFYATYVAGNKPWF